MKGRKLLMIPGPIEFEPEVISAMAVATTSHAVPNFIEVFGNSLALMKKIWMAPNGQPFIVAGSGTLAMDMAAANLVEKGDTVLVISTGYFGERFRDILERYGAKTTLLKAAIGETVDLAVIEEALKIKNYKMLTFTHVDTSTGVLVNPEPLAKLANKYNVLSVLDGVCSVAGEEIRQEEWGVDVVLTASQKAIGVPPGLALLVASQRAMKAWKARKTPVLSYYSDWANWYPIMKAYEERRPSYFGTPPVNLIVALETSLKIIAHEGLKNRIERHQRLASAFRASITSLGLKLVPGDKQAANTLTAIYYPENSNGAEFCAKMAANDVIVAGGLLSEIKATYFRVGHMGSVSSKDIIATISAIEQSLDAVGYKFEIGQGLSTFQRALIRLEALR